MLLNTNLICLLRHDRKSGDNNLNLEARFNFEGEVVTDDTSIPATDGLNHHGSDPERAGYTLNELLIFIESTYPSQKVIGLNIMGKIMERANRGLYHGSFDQCIEAQILESTNLLLMVRKSLDDVNSSVVTSAVTCLKKLLCNTDLDELYLDRIFCWNFSDSHIPNPVLQPVVNLDSIKSDDDRLNINEIKDDDLVKIDPILCLVKSTDLLNRLRYLLDNNFEHQDDPVILKNLFDILIRISRHSKSSCETIITTPFLLESIYRNFLQPKVVISTDTVYGNPYPKALKLFRIMMSYGHKISKLMLETTPDFLKSCQIYLTSDPSIMTSDDGKIKKFNASSGLELSIESLRVYCHLLKQKISSAAESLMQLFPVLMRQSQYMLGLNALNSSNIHHHSVFDWQFSSTLITCLQLFHDFHYDLTGIGIPHDHHDDDVSHGCHSTDSNVKHEKRQVKAVSSEYQKIISSGIKPIIEASVNQWLTQMINGSILPSVDIMGCISSGISFMISVYINQTRDDKRSIDILKKLLITDLINLKPNGTTHDTSHLWKGMIEKMISRSSFISSLQKKKEWKKVIIAKNQLNFEKQRKFPKVPHDVQKHNKDTQSNDEVIKTHQPESLNPDDMSPVGSISSNLDSNHLDEGSGYHHDIQTASYSQSISQSSLVLSNNHQANRFGYV